MTIAKRLTLLLAVPLLILISIGVITRQQMAGIETRTRFVVESRIVALVRLGEIMRSFTELRVNVRSFLLATSQSTQVAARKAYDDERSDLTRLLDDYADKRITTDKGRRFLNDFRVISRDWMAGADQVMLLAAAGRKEEANTLLSNSMVPLGASQERLAGLDPV